MAESVAFYLKDPENLVQELSKNMNLSETELCTVQYISKIPDHLTFEVLNLWPDYDYPG